MTQIENNTTHEKTMVFYSGENVVRKVLRLFSNTKSRVVACVDHTRPLLAIETEGARDSFLDARNRGIKTRFITEITSDNISYCKELVRLVDELRHLDGIKGNFYVNETEYPAPTTFHDKGRPAPEFIYSNQNEFVEHQHYVFDTLWNKSIPAEEKIREIEDGITPEFVGMILDPFEVQRVTFKLLKSAKEEILIAFSTANALRRQERVGSIGLLKEAASRGVKVKILTPEDDRIVETKLKLESQKIDIRYIEESSQISYLIVDRKSLLVVELRDDSKEITFEAMGFSTHSTRRPTVISYASIFDSLWRQAGLYQQSKDKLHVAEDALDNLKEYLNEILKEVNKTKNKTL
jgi:two-component system sensor histidine kinase VicK